MNHPLDGCRLKVAQAIKDFDVLHGEIVGYAKANPYPIAIERELQSRTKVIKVGEPLVLPAEWGLRAGLCAYSARSALEHLVYELAAKCGGDPEREKTQFPIALNRDQYFKARRKRARSYRDKSLAGIDERWRKKIDEVQPYNHVSDPACHPLAVLGQLSNRDKHRTLSPAYGAIKTGRFVVSPTGPVSFRNIEIRETPDGIDVQAEIKKDRNPSRNTTILGVQEQVDMLGKVGAEVVFQCDDRLVTVSDIKAAVTVPAAIIDWLAPAFDDRAESHADAPQD